jgi:hypothetical protein
MTFREWFKQRHGFYPEVHSSQGWVKTQRDAYDAGLRSGFSLGTEAAAKVCHVCCIHGCEERIDKLRYEDVKGEP